jgi:hypothetical protein
MEEFIMYATEMASGDVIYTLISIHIGAGV